MTPSELAHHLQQGATLSLDTNIVLQPGPFAQACLATRQLPVQLVLSTPVLTELAMDWLADGEATAQLEALRELGVTVVDFGQEDALATAAWLHAQFPGDVDWQRAKRTLTVRQLLATAYQANARCSATLDWLIAGHAHARGWILVTHDRGREFQALAQQVTGAQWLAALRSLGLPLAEDVRFD